MKHKNYAALLVCMTLLIVWGCSENATIPVTGTVYGIVVNPDGTPADSVKIIIEDGDNTFIDEDLFVYTNRQGEFVVNDIPSVDNESIGKVYNIRGEGEVDVFFQGRFQPVPAGFIFEDFSVPGQQAYDMGTIVLQETATYWGKVLLEDKDEYDGDHSGIFISVEGFSFQAVTQSNGYYYLTKLPPHDNFMLLCEHPGYHSLEVGPIIVRPGIRTQGGSQSVLRRLDRN